jgi:hypothetical protein
MPKRLQSGVGPDLAGVHATRLSLIIALPDTAGNVLPQSLNVDANRAAQTGFVSNYVRGRKKHQAYAHFIPSRGKGFPRRLHVLYDLEPVEFEGETRTIPDLFAALTALDAHSDAVCSADFEYRDTQWSSLLKLPWRPLEMERLPFDEFRGFRAVKLRNGDVLYSIVVDRPTSEEIAHSLRFSYPARLDGHLPATLLERAVEISRLFVSSKAPSERPKRESQ